MSKEQKQFLKRYQRNKFIVLGSQILIIISFLLLWEYLAKYKIINPFIFSSPSRILETLQTLYHSEIPLFAKIIEPFLTMLNSLPKVALGPIIIIWTGANVKSIIVMALLINLIISILNFYNGFLGTDSNKLKLMKSFQANKSQTLLKLVIPSSKNTIISSLKLNISMTLIGVIMGEFLVSKKGVGYLIIYGTQVFNLNLVMAGIIILVVMSFLIYECVAFIEKKLSTR